MCKNPENKKKEKPYHVYFLFMKAESSQCWSPQNSTGYTNVMDTFPTFKHLNDITYKISHNNHF